MRTAILALLLALPLAGCFKIDEPQCAYSCSDDSVCPNDYACSADGYCHKKGFTGVCPYSTLDGSTVTVDLTATPDQSTAD